MNYQGIFRDHERSAWYVGNMVGGVSSPSALPYITELMVITESSKDGERGV